MSSKLCDLKDDIMKMPKFMRKVRMMMIPSVGYFTVVSKCEQSYIDFINEGISKYEELKDCKDEDFILDVLLGDTLGLVKWKICFLSETDIYL